MTEPVYLNATGLLESYRVELLCEAPVSPVAPELRARLGAALGDASRGEIALVEGAGVAEDALVCEQRGGLRDAGDPPSWRLSTVAATSLDPAAHDALHFAIAQSWWDEAEARAHAALHRLALEDRRFLTLDYRRRLVQFRTVLAAVLRAVPCRAVHWSPTQQLVDPEQILAAQVHDPEGPLPGALNVRFYVVDPRDSRSGDREHVMDTLGLGALGLVDLQCHFRGLDPEAVGDVLLRTGCYLYERGLVVRDGDSVKGPGPQDRWRARKALALSPPEREVLELDPGFPFSVKEDGY